MENSPQKRHTFLYVEFIGTRHAQAHSSVRSYRFTDGNGCIRQIVAA